MRCSQEVSDTYSAESCADFLSVRVVVWLSTILLCDGILESPDKLAQTINRRFEGVRLAFGNDGIASLNV